MDLHLNMVEINRDRIHVLADHISCIDLGTFRRVDENEPELQAFRRLVPDYKSHSPETWDVSLALSGLLVGLIDYQEYAQTLWKRFEASIRKAGYPGDLNSVQEVAMRIASASRMAGRKRARLSKAFAQGFTSRFWEKGILWLRAHPWDVWKTLAARMGDLIDRKTVVMAMKAFDMETLVATGGYLPFPADVPIMVDSRVARLTVTSGLLRLRGDEIRLTADGIAQRFKPQIVSAWAEVVDEVQRVLGPQFSAMRLDSLLWQASEFRDGDALNRFLIGLRLREDVAKSFTRELLLLPWR